MKCSICGTESKGDARFCPGCGATLITPKADETMLDLRTALFRRPVIVPAAAPSPVAGPPAASQQAIPPTTAPARSSIGGLFLVLVALGVIGYFVYQVATTQGASLSDLWSGMSRTPAEPAQTAASSPATATTATAPPTAESVAPAGPPPSAEVPPPATPVAQPTRDLAPGPAAVVAVPAPAPAAEPAKNSAAPVSAPPITNPAASSPKPATPRSSDARAPKSTETPASAPVAAPAAVPAPHPAAATPRSDRWQDMKDARTRCGRENLISRVVCEQRVLYLYCDGYWGRVPQCPDAQNPDPRK